MSQVKTDESLFVELDRLSSVLSKAAPKSAKTISQALTELRRLNLPVVQTVTPAPAPTTAAVVPSPTPQPAPDLPDDTPIVEDEPEATDTPPPAPPPPKFYALKYKGKFLEPFAYCDWDKLHRVAAPGFPGVWVIETANAMSELFNKLGADFEVVDTVEMSPKGVRRA